MVWFINNMRIFKTKRSMIVKNKHPDRKKVIVPSALFSIKSKKPIDVIKHCSQKGIDVKKHPKLKYS